MLESQHSLVTRQTSIVVGGARVQEVDLKARLRMAIKQRFGKHGFVYFRHEDLHTAGIPDMSLTANGRTTWWEVKHGHPGFPTSGVQQYICNQLANEGYCRYIIYQTGKAGRRVMIVHPAEIVHNTRRFDFSYEAMSENFDHKFVADFIFTVHFG